MSVDLAAVLTRLSALGPPSEIRSRAPSEAAAVLDLDRVLLTSVQHGVLVPEALHVASADAEGLLAALRQRPVALEYPLIEGELLRQRRAQVVRWTTESPARRAFAETLGWKDYIAAPVLVDGRVIAFLHADRQPSERPIGDDDATAVASFGLCFALVFERALLRHRLRVQRDEMRHVAAWADARTSDLGERAITLADGGADEGNGVVVPSEHERETPFRDLLTRREIEVLELMVRGDTNAAIARDLVVSEGTVKFHVKNILRKLHATNRAEATSRYLRMTLHRS